MLLVDQAHRVDRREVLGLAASAADVPVSAVCRGRGGAAAASSNRVFHRVQAVVHRCSPVGCAPRRSRAGSARPPPYPWRARQTGRGCCPAPGMKTSRPSELASRSTFARNFKNSDLPAPGPYSSTNLPRNANISSSEYSSAADTRVSVAVAIRTPIWYSIPVRAATRRVVRRTAATLPQSLKNDFEQGASSRPACSSLVISSTVRPGAVAETAPNRMTPSDARRE